ncbi:HisA/HisF-related TIM barrel protein [Agarivorans sp. QJM3NY_29]|uniref:HisA/HisF-related TIM barrel protein n=1 Tax=unclassified Agarivorans TaxID=2636026 RepID=UPI003D7C39E5
MNQRIVAKVTIFNGIAYQTEKFRPNIYLGCPINICNILSDQGCQELVLNFVRSAPNMKFVEDILSVCRSPVTVGGVCDQIEDYTRLVSSGAEKVIVSDSVWAGTNKVYMLAERFGRQAVAVSVDYIENAGERYVVGGQYRKDRIGKLTELLDTIPIDFVGEIILNNVSRDGQETSLDLDVINYLSKEVRELPILLSGGLKDFSSVKKTEFLDGVVSTTAISLYSQLKSPLTHYPAKFSVKGR